jgi:hypothetical protein
VQLCWLLFCYMSGIVLVLLLLGNLFILVWFCSLLVVNASWFYLLAYHSISLDAATKPMIAELQWTVDYATIYLVCWNAVCVAVVVFASFSFAVFALIVVIVVFTFFLCFVYVSCFFCFVCVLSVFCVLCFVFCVRVCYLALCVSCLFVLCFCL